MNMECWLIIAHYNLKGKRRSGNVEYHILSSEVRKMQTIWVAVSRTSYYHVASGSLYEWVDGHSEQKYFLIQILFNSNLIELTAFIIIKIYVYIRKTQIILHVSCKITRNTLYTWFCEIWVKSYFVWL